MNLGEKIKYYRNQLNLSQEQLAQKSELSRNAIYNYENNKRVPTMDILIKISDALDVDIEELLSREKIIYSGSMKEIEKLIEKYPDNETSISETIGHLADCLALIYVKKGCNNRDLATSNINLFNDLIAKISELLTRDIVSSPLINPVLYTKFSLNNITEINTILNKIFLNKLAMYELDKAFSSKEGE